MNILWFPYGFDIKPPFSYGFPMVFPWKSSISHHGSHHPCAFRSPTVARSRPSRWSVETVERHPAKWSRDAWDLVVLGSSRVPESWPLIDRWFVPSENGHLVHKLVGGDWNMNFIFPYIGKDDPIWLSYFWNGMVSMDELKGKSEPETRPIFPWRSWDLPLLLSPLNQSIDMGSRFFWESMFVLWWCQNHGGLMGFDGILMLL